MLKFLKKLFNADVTVAPVVSVIEDEVKTYDSVNDAIEGKENDIDSPKTIDDNLLEKDND